MDRRIVGVKSPDSGWGKSVGVEVVLGVAEELAVGLGLVVNLGVAVVLGVADGVETKAGHSEA